MKKFLLFLLCTVCMTAAAERISLSQYRGKQVKMTAPQQVLKAQQLRKDLQSAPYSYSQMPQASKQRVSSKNQVKASAYNQVIESTYNDYTQQGWGTFYIAKYVDFVQISDNWVMAEADEELGTPEVTHPVNVSIQGLYQGLCQELVGYIDTANDSLWVPAQIAYTDQTYGQMAIFGMTPGEQEGYVGLTDSIHFKLVEDEFGTVGYELTEPLIGYCLFMLEGEYAGYIYDSFTSENFRLHQPNYLFTYSTNSIPRDSEEFAGWQEEEPQGVYVENTGDAYRVHGFPNVLFTVDAVLDMYPGEEEGTFEVPFTQDMIYYTAQNIMVFLGNYAGGADGRLDPTISGEGYIKEDGTFVFAYPAYNEDGTPKVDEESGKPVYEYERFFPGAYQTSTDSEGQETTSLIWWSMLMGRMQMTPLNLIEGVNTVLAPTAAQTGSYNLAGQRINAATRGISIQNGVKVLK